MDEEVKFSDIWIVDPTPMQHGFDKYCPQWAIVIGCFYVVR